MSDKKEWLFDVAETRHYVFSVQASDEKSALVIGREIWRGSQIHNLWLQPYEEIKMTAAPIGRDTL